MADQQERSEWDLPEDDLAWGITDAMAGDAAGLGSSMTLLNHRLRVLGDKVEGLGSKLDRLAEALESRE